MDRATRKCGTRLIQPLVSLGAEQVRKFKFLSPVPSFEEPEGHVGHEAQHTAVHNPISLRAAAHFRQTVSKSLSLPTSFE
jgi:hypothetical protein